MRKPFCLQVLLLQKMCMLAYIKKKKEKSSLSIYYTNWSTAPIQRANMGSVAESWRTKQRIKVSLAFLPCSRERNSVRQRSRQSHSLCSVLQQFKKPNKPTQRATWHLLWRDKKRFLISSPAEAGNVRNHAHAKNILLTLQCYADIKWKVFTSLAKWCIYMIMKG